MTGGADEGKKDSEAGVQLVGGPLGPAIRHLIEEEFRKYRSKKVYPWSSFNSRFRWADFDDHVIAPGDVLFAGTVRQLFWDLAGDPFIRDIVIRALERVARMADDRGHDRNTAVLEAVRMLKSRAMGTYEIMRRIDARLVHGHGGSRDKWIPPDTEKLTKRMDEFIDGMAVGWLTKATSAQSSSPVSTVDPGKVVNDGVVVAFVGEGRHRRVELSRDVGSGRRDSVEIRGESLIRLFKLVVDAKGEVLSWEEVERRWLSETGWKGHISANTLRAYGRRIKERLDLANLSKYWRYGTDCISWKT